MYDVSYRVGFTDATRPELDVARSGSLAAEHRVKLPEDVEAAFEIASPFSRVFAIAIDLAVITGLFLALLVVGLILAFMLEAVVPPMLSLALLIVAVAGVNLGYFLVLEGFFGGRTPGKAAMRLRVVREDGEEIGPREGVIRAFMRMAVIGPMPALLVAGVFSTEVLMMVAPFASLGIVMFIDRKTRSLGDLAAGTVVVLHRPPALAAARPYVPGYFQLPQHYFQLNHAEMSRLTPDDYVRLEEFGTRLSTISSAARQQAAMAAAAALATRMNYSRPIEPAYAELFLFEMHAALKQQLQQLYPDLYQ